MQRVLLGMIAALALLAVSAEAVVKAKPEKVAKQIDRAVEKIAKKFDSMYRKGR